MAKSNLERVASALALLKSGLKPFVQREFLRKYGQGWRGEIQDALSDTRLGHYTGDPLSDVMAQLVLIDRKWGFVFKRALGQADRSLVNEIIVVRNRWAHQQAFSSDDTDRALDSIARLLNSVSAPEANEVNAAKNELRRTVYQQQVRSQKHRTGGTLISSEAAATLKPWREVVTPHPDVASGQYQQAEFAADLWNVHIGQGGEEYRKPLDFFRRTYLTESLKAMLVGAARRFAGAGGDPVVQLQTNFGGGKTHSMLALYHLCSGVAPKKMPGLDVVMSEAGVAKLPAVKRVVLVGNKISPGNPVTKDGGLVVRTLWGELAWQLGGPEAFARIAADDERATNPGDELRKLMLDYGPCLILIDEWVAYARQLHEESDLPAGSFETQFSFAQALTESAKAAENCLLVVSLPASDTGASQHSLADNVEVGGERGREALDRLANVMGRIESSWRPATAEEGFEIVRRRLFEPLADDAHFKARDVVARAFSDFYRSAKQDFPQECREGEYEKRLQAAYPIHPEIFDRLYSDWSTLVKFQRTRGVLRLMATVIHSLWENEDRSPLIMPANIAIDDARVLSELTRYLPDNWGPIIEKDVDGPNSLPRKTDAARPNFGKYTACRRVARTLYMGSAPNVETANRGLEDRAIKLGCALPGEAPAIFGDALRQLAGAATYLYQDGNRYWYATQPTVAKLAADRTEQFKRDMGKFDQKLETVIRKNLRAKGDFARVHPLPHSSADVLDECETRLVVLGPNHACSNEKENDATRTARDWTEKRGGNPRIYRNALIFLAPDKMRLAQLEQAACSALAWRSILDETEALGLSQHQIRQAEAQYKVAEDAVEARLPETYCWVLRPQQKTPTEEITWERTRLSAAGALAERVSKKLKSDEHLITRLGAARLRMEVDKVPLWDNDRVEIRKLAEDFARYAYLPRLRDAAVLLRAINEGVESMAWEHEAFAFADAYDEATGRYQGLCTGRQIALDDLESSGFLVRAEAARRQLDAESEKTPEGGEVAPGAQPGGETPRPVEPPQPPAAPQPKRFFGAVVLDNNRLGREAGQIGEEIIAHLASLSDATVKVTLEVEATVPSGVPEQVVRTVTENSRTLKFRDQGFEEE